MRIHRVYAVLLAWACLCKSAIAASEPAHHVVLPATAPDTGPVPQVAVIGAGIGGAAATHFLTALNQQAFVTVFERAHSVGGRAKEMPYGSGPPQELGASIIHGSNKWVLSLAKEMGLELAEPGEGDGTMAVFDGEKVLLRQTGQPVLDLFRVLKRYGISPVRYGQLAKEAGRRFASIYAVQEAGGAFRTPEDMLAAMGLYNLTQMNALEHLKESLTGIWKPGAERFANELAGAVDRVNYNQAISTMNAMAALVSYLPAADPSLVSIQGGNSLLPLRLLEHAERDGRARVRLGAGVTEVTRLGDGRYQLNVTGDTGPPAVFDAVIIAAPLEGSGIRLSGLSPPPRVPPREFQRTVTTYVQGAVNITTFGKDLPQGASIFVTADSATKFSSISPKGPCLNTYSGQSGGGGGDGSWNSRRREGALHNSYGDSLSLTDAHSYGYSGSNLDGSLEGCSLFKVFSRGALSDSDLDSLFTNPRVVDRAPWRAYPKFSPPEKFSPFEFAPGLVYSNALENAASAMEVSAVAAKNSALLVAQYI